MVYERDLDDNWQFASMLKSDNDEPFPISGAFAVSGNRAIVGSVFGERANNLLGLRQGKAIIFERQDDGEWEKIGELQPDVDLEKDEKWPEQFGWSVSISGDIALVGACTDHFLGPGKGEVYVFERQSDGSWQQTTIIRPEGEEFFDSYTVVELVGIRAAVGTFFADVNGYGSGAVYFFERVSSREWMQKGVVAPSVNCQPEEFCGDQVGSALMISGNFALIGARYDDEINYNSGAAYEVDLTEFFGEKNKPYPEEKASANDVDVFPNPFAGNANMQIIVTKASSISLSIFNAYGQLVDQFINEQFLQPGTYSINLNAMGWPSGVYFVRMTGEYGHSMELITHIK